ncbi:MAG: heavy metal translocating P-type ATPase [Eubacteriales bacterium]|nr:heavy metal translocating P-type ATPase [Eubacteriales bacterium]
MCWCGIVHDYGPNDRRVFILEGLDCPNCAQKIEKAVQDMDIITSCVVTYANLQMRVVAKENDGLVAKLQAKIDSVEEGVTVIEKVKKKRNSNDNGSSRVFILEGLDCPNCAQKIENHVNSLPYIDSAVVTYANLQMRVDSKEADLVTKLQSEIDKVEEGINVVERKRSSGGSTTVFVLEGLDCPNCAQKIEDHLNGLSDIDEAIVTYANLQCRVTAKGSAGMTEYLQKEIDKVEEGITVVKKDAAKKLSPEENAKKKNDDPLKKSIKEIAIGAVLFIIPFIASHGGFVPEGPSWASAMFVIAYAVLGGKVLKTAWSNIKRGQMFDENFLMAIATLGAFGLGLYTKTWEFDEAVGVMLFYRIGEYFEQKATLQSRSQIMDAVDMRPEVVNLCVGDDVRVVDAEEAEVGDIVMVRPGDRIPLDGTVVEGETRIDTAPVTGEPVPVKASVGDEVISGCVNTTGVIKVRVEKPLEESMVTRILDSVENAAASKPQIDKFITRFSRIYTPFVVFFAIAVALIPSLLGAFAGMKVPFIVAKLAENTTSAYVEYWITTALTFLVISCPCALVLSVPLAFFSGIGAASKKGILFKGGIAIEGLNNIKAVVMDKTGTITEGNFVVQRIAKRAGCTFGEDELLAMAAACEMTSTHPIGTSIVTAAKEKGLSFERPAEMSEIAGKGIKANVNGKTVLCGNTKLMDEFAIDLSSYKKEGFGTEVMIAVDGTYEGNVIISDTIKKEAKDAIAKTKALGIITAMLTGDAQDSAEDVAAKTGIDEVHAKLMPQDKLTHLTQIREKHGNVMFVGDGINDAPVLAGADVGAAMGSGADAAIEAADVVFMTSSMDAIPEAIDIAKATNKKSWQNVYFALAIKVVVMILGLVGFANMWLAVFADTGVSMLCLLNSMLILRRK